MRFRLGKGCPFPFGPAPGPELRLLLPVLLYGGLFGGGPPTGLRLKLLSSRRPPTSRRRSSRCLFQWYGWGRFCGFLSGGREGLRWLEGSWYLWGRISAEIFLILKFDFSAKILRFYKSTKNYDFWYEMCA
uniref:(northern house mosquito) hypothetical protein n=1 Tax=Culex pipiens TaxID=7175 RepID=A0A8D8I6R9_CULPI